MIACIVMPSTGENAFSSETLKNSARAASRSMKG
jgi:hypothetical protein